MAAAAGARPARQSTGTGFGVVSGSCRAVSRLGPSIPKQTYIHTSAPTAPATGRTKTKNHNTYIHQSHPYIYISLCITHTGPQGSPLPRRWGGALAVVHGGRGRGGGAPGQAAWVAGGGGARGERGRVRTVVYMCVCMWNPPLHSASTSTYTRPQPSHAKIPIQFNRPVVRRTGTISSNLPRSAPSTGARRRRGRGQVRRTVWCVVVVSCVLVWGGACRGFY